MSRIYLDHAATTPVHPDVLAAMLPCYTQTPYNPSSIHTEGRAARAILDQARDRAAAALGVKRREITFTGSGTEADNQALLGLARTLRHRGKHIISSVTEHHAILHSLDHLREDGFEITLLPVNQDGLLDPQAFAAALRPDTILASIMYANNETGTVQPIAQLSALAHAAGALLHTDAVQAPGWLPLDARTLGVDLLALSAHKFYGPKGVGLLYVREGVPLPALIHGGGQEFGRRSGTENVAGIVGLSVALEAAVRDQPIRAKRVAALRDRLEAGLLERVSDMRVNAMGAPRLPTISNCSFAGVDSEALLMRLDLDGIAVSAGSACTSGVLEPSHVIAALKIDPGWHQGVIRFSLGVGTTDDEIDRVLEVVPRAVSDVRAVAPTGA